MFRLMKLMAFALFGYAVYEFFRGVSETGGGTSSQAGRSMGRGMSEAFGQAPGEGQLSGAGEGRDEATLDSDGGSVRHRVGRGVVSR